MDIAFEIMKSAMKEKDLEEIKRLINNGMKLNWTPFSQSVLPLVLAAQTGDIDFCRAIVELGACLHACKGLPSPLSNAVYLNSKEAVEVLIRLGCDVNEFCLQDEWRGKTPLKLRRWFTKSAREFLSRPTSLGLACLTENYDVATILLEAGADINKPDDDEYSRATPVHHLCKNLPEDGCSLARIIEYFRLRPHLNPKPDLSCRDEYGDTPLMTAAFYESLETVNLLLEEKVDVKAENEFNETALHYAIKGCRSNLENAYESIQIIVALLRAGCETDRPHWKDTPLNIIKTGPRLNDLICEILVKFGADPLRYRGKSFSLLHLAAEAGNLILMDMTIKAGFCVDAAYKPKNATPLMLSRTCLVTAKYLVQQHRARIDLKDQRGDTALHHCLRHGSSGVFAYLIIEGSPRCLDSYHLAVRKPRIVELLLLTEKSPLMDLMPMPAKDWMAKFNNSYLQSWKQTLFYQLSQVMGSNAHSLKHLCRLVIRDALAKHSGGRGILLVIESLPLPVNIKTYICYHEELNRLRLLKVLNNDDDDDDDLNMYDDDERKGNDLHHHRHRQRERPYDQIIIPQTTIPKLGSLHHEIEPNRSNRSTSKHCNIL